MSAQRSARHFLSIMGHSKDWRNWTSPTLTRRVNQLRWDRLTRMQKDHRTGVDASSDILSACCLLPHPFPSFLRLLSCFSPFVGSDEANENAKKRSAYNAEPRVVVWRAAQSITRLAAGLLAPSFESPLLVPCCLMKIRTLSRLATAVT